MNEISYWACQNGHIVPAHYMPHSGYACNVQGCAHTRIKHRMFADPVMLAIQRLLTSMISDDDAAFSSEVLELEAAFMMYVNERHGIMSL